MTAPVMSVKTANGRYYQFPGDRRMVPSITNIKNVKGLPQYTHKKAADYAARNRSKLAGLDEREVYQLVRSAPFQKTDTDPSVIGDQVHAWVDRSVKAGRLDVITDAELAVAPITARRMWKQYKSFVSRYQPRYTDSEFTVWSDTHGYAGTGDQSMILGDAVHVLADTKTGAAVYPDVALQLAPLAKADFKLRPDGSTEPIPPFDRFAVLYLRPTYYQLIPVEHIDEAFIAFLGLKACFDWLVSQKDQTLGFAPKYAQEAA